MVNKDFQKGKIYFIGNFQDNDIYIGHTTQTLKRRFQKHKDSIKVEKLKHRKLYTKMIELGVEHFYIEEIEKLKCPCNSIDELEKRERHYILERQPVLNIQIPQRTMEEWKQDKKEHLQEYEKQRHLNNPRAEYRREYREEKRHELNEYNQQYRENNPEYFQEYNQQKYKNNPEYFKKYQEQCKEKVECECGATIARGGMRKHFKTKKHQNFLNNNIENELSEETGSNEIQEANEYADR